LKEAEAKKKKKREKNNVKIGHIESSRIQDTTQRVKIRLAVLGPG
jgi:hypothetical protein